MLRSDECLLETDATRRRSGRQPSVAMKLDRPLSSRHPAHALARNRKISVTLTITRTSFHLQIVPAAPAFSQPGSCAIGVVGICSSSINASGVYSGGSGGGRGLVARAANSAGNFWTKLCVGHAQASPKAQIVRPAILSPIVFKVFGSSVTPPPRSIRSVIFCIQSEPSRHGVHWPQLSW